MYVVIADHFLGSMGLVWRRPTLRLPARRRNAIREGGDHHDDKIDQADDEERLRHADGARACDINAFWSGYYHAAHIASSYHNDFPKLARNFRKAITQPGYAYETALKRMRNIDDPLVNVRLPQNFWSKRAIVNVRYGTRVSLRLIHHMHCYHRLIPLFFKVLLRISPMSLKKLAYKRFRS